MGSSLEALVPNDSMGQVSVTEDQLAMTSATEAEGQFCDRSIGNEFVDALADLFAAEA